MLGSARVASGSARRSRARETYAPVHLAPPDMVLFGVVATLVAIGLVMIYSATTATAYADYRDTAYYLKHQAMWAVIASVVAAIAYRLDYRKLKLIATPAVVLTAFALLLVLIPHLGAMAGGSRRWLGSGSVGFQPSELAKLAIVIFLAAKLSSLGENVRSLTRGVFPCIFVTAIVAVLIDKEPDMGTASLIVFTAFAMLFTAGARIEHLLMCLTAMLPVVAISVFASAYKRARIFAFLDPWKDPQNAGFHIVQSLLALGSGGIFGVGLGQSRQKFFYLPEQYTDFIFAILGEELGLIGAVVVLALFVTFAFRAVRIALAAPDRFGMLLAMGCTFTIVIQAFVNIGVVTSSWPVTGVPLPFLSYGGTSLVVSLVCVALIINVGRHRVATRA